MKALKWLRIILSVFVIIAGIGNLSTSIMSGLLCILCGISLIPHIYEKTKLKDIKYIQILLPLILFILFSISISTQNVNNNTIKYEIPENIVEEKTINIENLMFSETNIEIDIKETKDILVNIQPSQADTSELEFNSTNLQIADFSKNIQKSNGTIIYGQLQPVAEGECEIYVKSNDITSNKIKITVVDRERIENERKAQEEQARKEAEEAAKKQAEELASQKAAQEQAQKESQMQLQKQKTTAMQSATTTDNSRTVYKTPTGKRYHYSPTCGGKNSTATTLSNALSLGLTPCKKCAQ